MSLPHFYLSKQVLASEQQQQFTLRLDADDVKHARVLRLCEGEHIAVIDAVQDYFECEIVSFDSEFPVVQIACREIDAPSGPCVVLVQGLAKGDKMDTVIRHATELGVSAFIPLRCERSVVKLDEKKSASKTTRWQAIAKSAAMQSGQKAIPEVSTPLSLAEVCQTISQATAVLVCWEEAPQTARIADAIQNGLARCVCQPQDARIVVVVGPEGGLTQKEVDAFLGCNVSSSLVTLGPSILRTETAGIVGPALVLYELSRENQGAFKDRDSALVSL